MQGGKTPSLLQLSAVCQFFWESAPLGLHEHGYLTSRPHKRWRYQNRVNCFGRHWYLPSLTTRTTRDNEDVCLGWGWEEGDKESVSGISRNSIKEPLKSVHVTHHDLSDRLDELIYRLLFSLIWNAYLVTISYASCDHKLKFKNLQLTATSFSNLFGECWGYRSELTIKLQYQQSIYDSSWDWWFEYYNEAPFTCFII